MEGIIKIEQSADKKEEIEIPQLEEFPESVRDLFSKLPDSLKIKIFPKELGYKKEDSLEESDTKLEKIIASFDIETRQEYMGRCLNELFKNAKFRDRFESIGEDNLKEELERLLNLLWQNRGKNDDVDLFNKEYYVNFFKEREIIAKKIRDKKTEIDKLRDSIETTKKQKRLTERKKDELKGLEEEKNLLINEIEEYDRRHNNNGYPSGVSLREKSEKEWTKTAAITSEYLDPTEFVFIAEEELEKLFYKEFSIASNPNKEYFGRKLPEEIVEKAKRITKLVSQTIDEWSTVHENDAIFKNKAETRLEARQAQLIEYLISVMSSYQRGKLLKKSDKEMYSTVVQIEISLNFLIKLFGDKK